MNNFKLFLIVPAVVWGASCSTKTVVPDNPDPQEVNFTKQNVASMFADIPLDITQLKEVHNAVNQSSENGYDEEYTLSSILHSPGEGVGGTKATVNLEGTPLRDLITNYLVRKYSTKGGASDVEKYLNALGESDYQIYWPNSDSWDGKTFPIVTFDPGFGVESNYGYEISFSSRGVRVVDSVYVDEEVAKKRPVWVINSNDDRYYRPVDFLFRTKGAAIAGEKTDKQLVIKDFTMLRNYDSWFAGASEFVIKAGYLKHTGAYYTETELQNYIPEMTDMMLSVRRKDVGKTLPMDALLVSGVDENLEKMVLMITEDDGGTRTSWKCAATVKVKSKSYGIDIELPYNDKDDIVWRGNLAMSFFDGDTPVQGRFSDVKITFALE